MGLIIRNTTDIPDSLIAFAVAFSIEAGVEINEIIVKNKAEGVTRGQWGWYFVDEKRVVLIVPREVNLLLTFGFRQKYSKRDCIIKTRAEFVIAVMAHELRHAAQYQLNFTKWAGDIMNVPRELDAEHFEYNQLLKFHREYGDVQRAASKVK